MRDTDPQCDLEILRLWRRGNDTLDIARALRVREHVIASILPYLREKYRGWDFDGSALVRVAGTRAN